MALLRARTACATLWLAAASVVATAPCSVLAADILRGADVYQKHCGICHGASGISSWPGAPNLARREGMLQPDLVLLKSLREGRNAMPAFQGILNDQDIINAIAFSRTLAK